jgi:ATP-binding cassette subfamily C protein LapB
MGLTGAAGSGKSTLLMVMAGLRRPDAGRVWLDGRHDPYRHTEASLLGQIVHVSDRAPVFSGTLMENMTSFAPPLGSRNSAAAPLDRDRALDLADRLGLTGLAGRLPDGFNTEVGPGSIYALPHGLAQRIALVRALYCQPRILLFDAANTALDTGGDAMLRQLLVERPGRCTLVLVSQRPSLLALADRVFTLAEGRLQLADPGDPAPRAGQTAGPDAASVPA